MQVRLSPLTQVWFEACIHDLHVYFTWFALFILQLFLFSFSSSPSSLLWMALSGGGEQWQWGSAGPEGHFSAWSDTLGPCCLAAQHGSPPYIRRTLPESAKRSFATYLEMNEQSGGLLQENGMLGCEILRRYQNEIYQRCFSGRCHGFFPPAINLWSHYLSSNYIKWNGCPIVLISVPYDLALHGNEMVLWSQWGLLLGSGGGGPKQTSCVSRCYLFGVQTLFITVLPLCAVPRLC